MKDNTNLMFCSMNILTYLIHINIFLFNIKSTMDLHPSYYKKPQTAAVISGSVKGSSII